jgi:hypothetical protein
MLTVCGCSYEEVLARRVPNGRTIMGVFIRGIVFDYWKQALDDFLLSRLVL